MLTPVSVTKGDIVVRINDSVVAPRAPIGPTPALVSQLVREATLDRLENLTPAQILAHQTFYNKTLDDVDHLRGGTVD